MEPHALGCQQANKSSGDQRPQSWVRWEASLMSWWDREGGHSVAEVVAEEAGSSTVERREAANGAMSLGI